MNDKNVQKYNCEGCGELIFPPAELCLSCGQYYQKVLIDFLCLFQNIKDEDMNELGWNEICADWWAVDRVLQQGVRNGWFDPDFVIDFYEERQFYAITLETVDGEIFYIDVLPPTVPNSE